MGFLEKIRKGERIQKKGRRSGLRRGGDKTPLSKKEGLESIDNNMHLLGSMHAKNGDKLNISGARRTCDKEDISRQCLALAFDEI